MNRQVEQRNIDAPSIKPIVYVGSEGKSVVVNVVRSGVDIRAINQMAALSFAVLAKP